MNKDPENAWLKKNITYTWGNKVNSDWLIKALKITKKDCVLDIGCGTGAHLDDIERKTGARCTGVDIRAELFKESKNRKVKLIYSDMRDLKLRDDSFTKIFSIGVFEHVPETGKVLDEAARVLKKKGKLLFTVPNVLSFFHITKRIKQVLGIWGLGYEASFTIRQLEKMLVKRGFVVERAYIIPHERISNVFNLSDNMLNRISNRYFGFFVNIVARKEK